MLIAYPVFILSFLTKRTPISFGMGICASHAPKLRYVNGHEIQVLMMQVDVVGWGPSLKLSEEDTLGWYTPAAFDRFLLLAAGKMGTMP